MATKLKKVKGWPDPSSLSQEKLVGIIESLQVILWGDDDGSPDADKEWSCDEIEQVADTLASEGLRP